jgi:hypothetical protein
VIVVAAVPRKLARDCSPPAGRMTGSPFGRKQLTDSVCPPTSGTDLDPGACQPPAVVRPSKHDAPNRDDLGMARSDHQEPAASRAKFENPRVTEAAFLFFGRSPSFARGTNPTLGLGGSLHLGEVED